MAQNRPSHLVFAVFILLEGTAGAQPNPVAEDERVCWKLAHAQSGAWNLRDAKALAADFVADAEFIASDGAVLVGREAIEARHAELLRTLPKDRRRSIRIRSMRALGAAGMIVDADLEITMAGKPAAGGSETRSSGGLRLRVRYAMINDGGRWWIAGQQETEVKEASQPE